MSSPSVYHALLRPPVIQILRSVGFHAASSAVVDSLTDLAARYLTTLAESVVENAANSHEDVPVPTLDDILFALGDAGALRPQKSVLEEMLRGEEDTRGLDAFLSWFSGHTNTEIRRVAGFIASEGELEDVDSLEKEDYLTGESLPALLLSSRWQVLDRLNFAQIEQL